MESVYNIKTRLRTWIEDESIDDSFLVFINYAVDEAEDLIDWDALCAEKTVSVTNGILTEPAEARKIVGVYTSATTDGMADHEFKPRNAPKTADGGGLVMYSLNPYEAITEQLGTATATITQGSATITSSAAFLTTWAGERLMIGNGNDLYEIDSVASTSSLTLSKPVRVASGSYTVYVRPIGTRRYLLKDSNEDVFTGDVVVKYQKKHPEMVSDADRLLIPCPQTVAILSLQQALITNKYDVDAQRLENALMMAKNREIDGHLFRETTQTRRDSLFSVRSARRTSITSRGL